MKREAKLLLSKACDALVLSVEFFNRPHDRGRVSASLILLDHAFEMLLKAAILAKGGKIREKGKRETIGFDHCVRKGLSDGAVQFLMDEQALLLQTINGLRDAAQHHLLEVSEGQLYLHAQAGLTLFRDLLKSVFGLSIKDHLPARVLPLSTSPPTSLAALFDDEIGEIRKLLNPKRRRKLEAEARLRPLAILNSTVSGEKNQPSSRELGEIGKQLIKGTTWQDVFKGAAAIEISAEGTGPAISLRLTKKEGTPVQLVPEGTPGASVVAVRRVDELGFYSLGAKDIARKVNLSLPKALAVVEFLKLKDNPEAYKKIKIGKSGFQRYSPKALESLVACLARNSADEIWKQAKTR